MSIPVNGNYVRLYHDFSVVLPELSLSEAIVYFFMETKWHWCQNRDEPIPCYISVRYISQPFKLGKGTVTDAFEMLQELGLITLVKEGKGRRPAEWTVKTYADVKTERGYA